MKIPYPSPEWNDCRDQPDGYRRVLVWHRVRPWCRFFTAVVGWWNGEEWLTDDHSLPTPFAQEIYQPYFWKDIIGPNNEKP